MLKSWQLICTSTRKGYVHTNVMHVNCRDFNIFSSHGLLPSDLVAQSVERRRSNPKVVGSIPTLVRVFLCPCVGPVPSVGLTLTWFTWDRNLALHVTLALLCLATSWVLRDQQPCFTTKTKESVYITIEFNSRRIGQGHQHGRRFFAWGHPQYGHDVMRNPRIAPS